jgi:hypothetical protein
MSAEPNAVEVAALADRLRRNDAADQRLRAAFNVLGPLIRELVYSAQDDRRFRSKVTGDSGRT